MAVVYGNWCGRGHKHDMRGADLPPLDELDNLCMLHDQCYAKNKDQDNCDKWFMGEVKKLIDTKTDMGRSALAVYISFVCKRLFWNWWH